VSALALSNHRIKRAAICLPYHVFEATITGCGKKPRRHPRFILRPDGGLLAVHLYETTFSNVVAGRARAPFRTGDECPLRRVN